MHGTENSLKTLMIRDGKRLQDVADHCAVDQSTVYRWHKGLTTIPDGQKIRLARYFNVSVEQLVGWPTDVAA